jgi:TonB family protein
MESYKSLQEAIEEIHKMVALERIQRKVARRGGVERRSIEGQSAMNPSQETTGSASKTSPLSGSGTGTGTGIGVGPGTGLGGFPGGSPWGSSLQGTSLLDSKLNEYYSLIWEKIKKEWTLPEDIPKGKTNLETVIVIMIERDGKIQKTWFEKRSGNKLYDQMAMRAIKKAEPLPSLPKEISENTFEIGIRFYPE